MRRASVIFASLGSSRKCPVVLARKMASYCFRLASLMSAGSYVMVVDHAPCFLPISSMVRAAIGIDECTNPSALPSTSTLRGCFGVTGALAGSAASIAVTCSGLGVWFCGGGAVRGGGGTTSASPRNTCSIVTALVPPLSHFVYHPSRPAFSSSRVSTPSLLASSSGNNAAFPAPPGPPPGRGPC